MVDKTVFAQLFLLISRYEFNKCVDRYRGNRKIRNFSCWDQSLAMAFAQLTGRDGLRCFAGTCLCTNTLLVCSEGEGEWK